MTLKSESYGISSGTYLEGKKSNMPNMSYVISSGTYLEGKKSNIPNFFASLPLKLVPSKLKFVPSTPLDTTLR